MRTAVENESSGGKSIKIMDLGLQLPVPV